MKNHVMAALKRAAAFAAFCVLSSIPFIANAQSFGYTGSVQTFTAPTSGFYKLKVWGAQGGSLYFNGHSSPDIHGGKGGYSEGSIWLNQGTKLYVSVGGAGGSNYGARNYFTGDTDRGGKAGGWNGGGFGGRGLWQSYTGHGFSGGAGGGGATSITTSLIGNGELTNYSNSRGNVLIVAGGGGGAGGLQNGGYGGGLNGETMSDGHGRYSVGGTQSSGYRFGKGGSGTPGLDRGEASCEGRGGGGGGWYGGNSAPQAYREFSNISGGGGSGYVNTSKLSNTSMQNGVQSGNGYAKIEPAGTWQNINILDPNGNEHTDGSVGTFNYHTDASGWQWHWNVSDQGSDTTLAQGQHIYISGINITNKYYVLKDVQGSSYTGEYAYTVPSYSSAINIHTAWKSAQITFNGNGGTIARNNQQTFTCNKGQSFSDTGAARAGYALLGWADSPSATQAQYSILSGVADDWIVSKYPSATIYAVWRVKSYTLTFYGNEGTLHVTDSNIKNNTVTVTYNSGNFYNLGITASRTGYTMDGFYTAASGGTKLWNNGGACLNDGTYWKDNKWVHDGDVNVYAHWIPYTYTVQYDANGATSGSPSVITQNFTYDQAQNLTDAGTMQRIYNVTYNINVPSDSASPANSYKSSDTAIYKAVGWSTSAGDRNNPNALTKQYDFGQSVSNLTTENNGTVNMYAVWRESSVTLPTPKRNGYTFDGWYDSASGGNKIGDGGASYVPRQNITLYAHWTTNTYHAYYSLYCGSAVVRKDFTVEDTFTLATPSVNNNYAFLGWIGGTDPQDHGGWGMNGEKKITTATKPITVPTGTYGDVFFRAVYQPTSQHLHDYPSANKNAYYAESSRQEIPY